MESTSLTTEPLTTSALLDQVRGVVSSKCNTGSRLLDPVSSITVRNALTRRCVTADVPALLRILLSLRDIQNLPFGHWLPASLHGVPCDQCILLVSGYPTLVLERDYGLSVVGGGLGRISAKPVDTVSLRSLEQWLGVPPSSREWSQSLFRKAQFGDPFGWEKLELFDHWSKRSARRWMASSNAETKNGTVLARSGSAEGPRSYYLLSMKRRAVDGLCALPHGIDARRLTLAMLAQAGNGYSFSMQESGPDVMEVRAPFLPHDELRLLSALGPVHELERGLTADIPRSSARAVRKILLAVGLIERRIMDD